MFLVLHRKVGIVFTLRKTIISDFWTQSALTHTALQSSAEQHTTNKGQHCTPAHHSEGITLEHSELHYSTLQ